MPMIEKRTAEMAMAAPMNGKNRSGVMTIVRARLDTDMSRESNECVNWSMCEQWFVKNMTAHVVVRLHFT
jgi:hypothetical protein